MQRSLLLFFAFLVVVHVKAAEVRCTNAEYAGKELIFKVPADPVSGKSVNWFSLKFDVKGSASVSVDVLKTTYTFADFGIYRGMLFLEPGKTIDLKLPPFREKSFADEKNPYFSPVSFWFVSENGNALNDKISAFENRFNYLTDKNFKQLYMLQSKTVFDSVQTELRQQFAANTQPAFQEHVKLKLDLLETDVFREKPESYAALFNSVKREFWLHPVFIEFFRKTFDNQLSFSAQAIKGEEIKKAVETRNLDALLSLVQKKYKVQGKMADLALLKMLHDAFYSKDFSKKAVIDLLSSPRFTKNQEKLLKQTSTNILEKLQFMEVGSAAPVICLNDLAGEKMCTNTSKDKFKYLVFADVETVVGREHLKYLSRINELFSKYLEIFVLLRDTDPAGVNVFFAENNVPAFILSDKGDVFSTKYKIRSFPQCYLLDEQHKIVFDDAKAPLNGFEQQFGNWLKNELFMRQGNQSK